MRISQILPLFALLLTCGAAAPDRPVVTLRSDMWCPYNCDPGSDHPGYAVEIARAVFADAGYDVDYQLMNWARSIDDARHGRADGVIGAYSTDVPGFVMPAEPIGFSAAGFARRRNTVFHYVDPHSLDGLVVGIVADYEFGGVLGDYLHASGGDRSRVQVIAGDGALAKNLAKLMAGRLDLVVDDALVLGRAVSDLRLDSQVTVSPVAERVPIYIAFSPGNPLAGRFADILDAGIARLRRSGRLALILGRYQVRDWHASTGPLAGLIVDMPVK